MREIIGDILTPNIGHDTVIVCHQVNCRGVMGAGLAKQVKNAFPEVYSAYQLMCQYIDDSKSLLGKVQFCDTSAKSGFIVANIFGQDRYGRDQQYTDYAALATAFRTISRAYPDYTVRIPYRMGCGLAGGNWKVVSQIIYDELECNGISVEIWKCDS